MQLIRTLTATAEFELESAPKVTLAVALALISAPPTLLSVLAVGTSVPDAMGSMAVAANGEADMAIANAVGSNVFDILLGLGVPWMLNGAIEGATTVDKCGIEVSECGGVESARLERRLRLTSAKAARASRVSRACLAREQ